MSLLICNKNRNIYILVMLTVSYTKKVLKYDK